METILITGGTGTIGQSLQDLFLEKGYEVIIVTRDPSRQSPKQGVSYAAWDIQRQTIDAWAISKASHIIHLAGAGVADKRWSADRKKEILNSRTQSCALLVKVLQEIPNQVKTVVSASAIGWYGPDTRESRQHGFSEEAVSDASFLGDTCFQWEKSIQPVSGLDKRLVILRTGIVLSNLGGAFVEFKKPLKAGIAAILGTGDQMISWIHTDDLCHMYLHAIRNESLHGVYNAVAPEPVTNSQLTLTLARQMRGRFFIPVHVPSFLLKIMLGEMSIEVLKSATVSAGKIQKAAFVFQYPAIDAALTQLLAT
jgi:uncharacterized protein